MRHVELGEEVHRAIAAELHVEREGWAPELLARATARLAPHRSGEPLVPVVVWVTWPLAFTLPGRYVYVSRELLSRGLTEGGAAFVLGHEMAHHDLGHLDVMCEWLNRLGPLALSLPVAAVIHALSRVHRRKEDETAADRAAFELCRRAGYPDTAGLELFKLLERIALDYRQVDGVFGGIMESATHPPVRDRREAVERWMREPHASAPSFSEFVRRRRGRI